MTTPAVSRLPPKVIEEICRSALHEGWEAHERGVWYRAVAALARTCRLFQVPALNVLWEKIHDIALLFYTLPEHVYRVDPDEENQIYTFNFTRTPRKNDLRRFWAYASRVKSIHEGWNLTETVLSYHAGPEAYHTLATILGTRPLLPNIKAISWLCPPSTPSAVFRSFHILFGKRLRAFDIRISVRFHPRKSMSPSADPLQEAEDIAVMLQHLKKLSGPRLQKLSWSLYLGTPGAIGRAMSTILSSGFQNLTKLFLPMEGLAIGPFALAHLGSLPSLSWLYLYVEASEADFDLETFASHAARPLYPALEYLHMTGSTMALLVSILACVSSPVLNNLGMCANEEAQRGDIDRLFNIVGTFPSRDIITGIEVRVEDVFPDGTGPAPADDPAGDPGEDDGEDLSDDSPEDLADDVAGDPVEDLVDDPAEDLTEDPAEDFAVANHPATRPCPTRAPEPITEKTLTPLLSMRNLKSIELEIHCPHDLDDAFLEKLARALPNLERLTLGVNQPWGIYNTDIRVGEDASTQDYAQCMSAWTRPRTTLAGLATVARLCPKLNWLGWELDASLDALPPARLERRPGLGMIPRRIFTLNVGLSPIEDPWAVAAFLSDMFPWLESIDHGWKALEFDLPDGEIDWGREREGWSLPKRYGIRWENARALIAKFAKIRGHERAWKREKTGEEAPKYQLELGEDPEGDSD